MGSTLTSITLRSVTWVSLLVYMYSFFYTFLSFSFYGRVVSYVLFFSLEYVK
jgi:hypothetical protein